MLALSAAAPGARLVQIGNGAGTDTTVPADILRGKQLSILRYATYHAPRESHLAAFDTSPTWPSPGRSPSKWSVCHLRMSRLLGKRQRAGAPGMQILIPGGIATDLSHHT
jgi:hypothetical protein